MLSYDMYHTDALTDGTPHLSSHMGEFYFPDFPFIFTMEFFRGEYEKYVNFSDEHIEEHVYIHTCHQTQRPVLDLNYQVYTRICVKYTLREIRKSDTSCPQLYFWLLFEH